MAEQEEGDPLPDSPLLSSATAMVSDRPEHYEAPASWAEAERSPPVPLPSKSSAPKVCFCSSSKAGVAERTGGLRAGRHDLASSDVHRPGPLRAVRLEVQLTGRAATSGPSAFSSGTSLRAAQSAEDVAESRAVAEGPEQVSERGAVRAVLGDRDVGHGRPPPAGITATH